MNKAERAEAMRQCVHLFIGTNRLHRSAVDRMATKLKIHRGQHMVLMFLEKCDRPVSQKEIADAFEISTAAVAVSVKRLEGEGYITRTTSESDQRCNDLLITQKGIEAVRFSQHFFATLEAEMLADLDDDQLIQLTTFLEKMQNRLRMYDENGAPAENPTEE